MLPPKQDHIEYLKLEEIESGRYYNCGLTGIKVFVRSVNRKKIMDQEAIEGIYYDSGRYRIGDYFDYMLY